MQTIAISPKVLQVITLLNKAVKSSPTGVSFVSIKNYTNSSNEISNNLINIGASYAKAKQSDIQFLENIDLAAHNFTSELSVLETAKAELIAAFIKPDENRSNGQIDAYTPICSGIKVHNETGVLYVYGYRENKTVLQKGEYKTVKSSAKTIAKNELRKLLKTGKFTQYALEIGNEIKAKGDTIEL
jgi:hypothetical protein